MLNIRRPLGNKNDNIVSFHFTAEPNGTTIKFSQNPVRLGDSVTIKCESRGFPGPNYTITLNGTIPVSAEKMYTIDKVKWNDSGIYNCTATNTLGSDLGSGFLDVFVTAGKIKINTLSRYVCRFMLNLWSSSSLLIHISIRLNLTCMVYAGTRTRFSTQLTCFNYIFVKILLYQNDKKRTSNTTANSELTIKPNEE
jgi:hypothetical protein